MQLADSALPIGTLAHSFGMETLVAEGALSVHTLEVFLRDYLLETGTLEAAYCLKAYHIAGLDDEAFDLAWLSLNRDLDALKIARESREASTALGRRFHQLALKLDAHPRFEQAGQLAKSQQVGIHHCAAFGLACGVWMIDREMAVSAFLQQSVTSLVSGCQRLMPLGQTQASRLIWDLKPAILEAVARADQETPFIFAAAVEVASMRHPDLTTRLFIS